MPRPIALLFALAAPLVFAPRPVRAALIPRYDLATLCSQSTDVVEARLTRSHQRGKPEWDDTFSATVLSALAGSYKAGDRLPLGDALSLYDPARTGQHCLLFLSREAKSVRVVDLRLIDSRGRVRRYFQQSNPGGLVAEGFRWEETGRRPLPRGGASLTLSAVEDDAGEGKYPTLVAYRRAVAAKKVTEAKTGH